MIHRVLVRPLLRVDPGAIQTAAGTFAALSLFAAIWVEWLFILNIVAWLDAQER